MNYFQYSIKVKGERHYHQVVIFVAIFGDHGHLTSLPDSDVHLLVVVFAQDHYRQIILQELSAAQTYYNIISSNCAIHNDLQLR